MTKGQLMTELEEIIGLLELASKLRKEMTSAGPVKRFGDVMVAAIHTAYNDVADHYYSKGYMDEDQRKAVGQSIGRALVALREAMPEELQSMEVE